MPATSMAVTMAMVLPTMDTMDTHMPTIIDTTMARGLLMPSLLPLLSPPLMPMLTTDTTDIPLHTLTTDTDMLTTDTMDTHMPTMDTTDMESNHVVTFYQDFEDLAAVKLVRYLVTYNDSKLLINKDYLNFK